MKKFLALFLTLLVSLMPYAGFFSLPTPAHADHNPAHSDEQRMSFGQTNSSAGTGIGESPTIGTQPISEGSRSGTGSGGFNLDSLGSLFGGSNNGGAGEESSSIDTQCSGSGSGGAGGNRFMNAILNQAGVDPNIINVLGGITGENGQVDTGALLGGIFGNTEIGEQLGNYGVSGESIINIFSGASGGSGINTGGFNIGSLFSGSGGSSGGGIVQGISGLFGGGSGGSSGGAITDAISGIAGGDIGGAIGGIAGGALGGIGGGNVPVADSDVKKAQNKGNDLQDEGNKSQERGNANTDRIKSETIILREKECGADIAISLASRALASEFSATTLETIVEGPTRPIESFAEFDRDTFRAGLVEFTDNYRGPHQNEVKRYLEQQIANAEDAGASEPVDCGSGGLDSLFKRGIYMFSGCDVVGSREAAKSRAQQAGRIAQQAARDAVTAPNTYQPEVEECVVDGVTYNDIKHCPNSRILTPASDVKALSEEAQKEGRELDRNADEPGELGESSDTALRNLTQTILGGFGGLLQGLTRRDRGASASGTYLDRVRNEAENVELTAGSGSVTGDITGAIILEGAYQRMLQSSVVELEKNAQVFENIRACFASLTQQPANLTTPIAQAASNASTTAHALIASANQKKDQINDSRDLVTELSELLSSIENEGSPTVIAEARSRYTLLSDTGAIHTNAQYTALSIETRAALVSLAASLADANAQLAQCEAYP